MARETLTIQKLGSYFLYSFYQCLVYGTIYVSYLLCFSIILGERTHLSPWIAYTIELIMPILGFLFYSLLTLRKNIKPNIKNLINKRSILKLLARLLAVFCFFCIGYMLSLPGVMPSSTNQLFNTLLMLLGNIIVYMIICLFPISFAFLEYILVRPTTKK